MEIKESTGDGGFNAVFLDGDILKFRGFSGLGSRITVTTPQSSAVIKPLDDGEEPALWFDVRENESNSRVLIDILQGCHAIGVNFTRCGKCYFQSHITVKPEDFS